MLEKAFWEAVEQFPRGRSTELKDSSLEFIER